MDDFDAEYKVWYDKYLNDIEALDKENAQKSPLSRTPKPLSRKVWIVSCFAGLLICMTLSCFFAWHYEVTSCWFLNWLSNALLSLSLGIVASLLIMAYTNIRDRNIVFYSDIIPILQDRYENMHKAYYDYTFKIYRCFYAKKYTDCYHAWIANYAASKTIFDFLRYLIEILPQNMTISLVDIDEMDNKLYEANCKIQEDFCHQEIISSETFDMCFQVSNYGAQCLDTVKELIQNLKNDLYGIKYGKVARAVDKNDEEI